MQPIEVPIPPLLRQSQERIKHLRQRMLSQRRELKESANRPAADPYRGGTERLDRVLQALDQMDCALNQALGKQQENP